MTELFGSPEMVEGYTRARPPVHPYVVERIRERLALTVPVARALDVGCGTGLSTSPLRGIADSCLGIDPIEAMVNGSPARAAGVRFAAARAEAIPVRSATIDIVTAAGSLNYADLGQFFPEAARVLRPGGALVVYDFSPGRRFRESPALNEWFAEFLIRYPKADGVATSLNPDALAGAAAGFHLVGSEQFEVALRLEPQPYCEYVLTETNVAHAIEQGEELEGIREWCAEKLDEVFEGMAQDVLFAGYLAHFEAE
jgi:SAM-dependent methyltransferase